MGVENFRQDKKFYLTIGVALGVLLLTLGYDSSMRKAAAVTRQNNLELEEELEDTTGKFLGQESVAERRLSVLKNELLPGVKGKIEFPDTLPTPSADSDPAVHLRRELTRIQRKMKNDAARKNIDIPERKWDIGDKIKQNNTPEEVAELRLRLAVTHAVIKQCIKSNIRRIRTIAHKEVIIEVIKDNTTTVVRRVPFVVEFEGDLYSVAGVLHAFQKEGSFLEVRGCRITDTGRGNTLSAKVHFAALRALDRSKVKETAGAATPRPKVHRGAPGRTIRRRPKY